ncbi:MAG: site-specific integrase [Bacteroidaceae bacterium]|nr:site-specific integrase [Bacteroidaceae bacterium]
MPLSERKTGARVTDILAFTPPKLHQGKKWFVDFLCYDPVTETMRRKKYHLDGIKKISDRKRHGAELVSKLLYRLHQGWNPWAEVSSTRQFASLSNIFDLFVRCIQRQRDTGAMRQKTYHSYHSMLARFREWCESCPIRLVYVYQLNKTVLVDFLEYIYYDRESSARTRNNYKTWLYMFGGWLIDRGYMTENPAASIKTIKEEPKKRDALSAEQLQQLRSYLLDNDRHYLLACMMEYYAFIRPEELTCLTIGDIRVKEQKIVVHGEWSKNRKDEAVGLNTELIKMMVDLEIFKFPSHYYLFGRHFTPAAEKTTGRIFREKFAILRKKFKWPDSIQFYSLKDSGIRDLANAEGIVIARDQARHADISTTNHYLKGDAMAIHQETTTFHGKL